MSRNNTERESTFDDFPWLTAQDVQLLYSIVEHAETSSERPFRALFAAYDQILTQNGISQAHDQKYLRFLLRMGELRKEVGASLFEQFRTLLSKLNIEVDFDAERGPSADTNMKEEEEDLPALAARKGDSLLVKQATPRRASFESAYDTSGDRLSTQQVELDKRPRSTELVQPSRLGPAPASKRQQPVQPSRAEKRKVSFSEVQHGPKSQVKRLYEEDTDVTSSRSDADDEYEPSDGNFTQEVTLPPKHDLDYEEEHDELEMNTRSKTLRSHHMMAKAVRIFRDWRQSAEAANRLHSHMTANAIAKDSETLKRQVFDHWHMKFRAKLHQKETEKFFDGLEKRASTARDLFLLNKAFTHWAQCTEDEVIRTSAARRHILRTRFFNAWRDITVVNELKIRRMRLSKVMNLWKRRTAATIRQEEQAKDHYRTQVVSSAYRNWFWSFCERRAPFWYKARHVQSVFSKWLEATRQAGVKASIAESYRQTGSIQTTLTVWLSRSTLVQRQLSEAESFRNRKLLLPNVETLRKELQLVPLHGEIHRNVISRIAREALKTWYDKTAACVRARRIDELRVMRNAWTAWNDNLRCKVLQRAIDERVAVQALYKWVIAGRLALFERVRSERLKRKIVSTWASKYSSTHNALAQASWAARASRNRRLSSSTLGCWHSRTLDIRETIQHAEAIRDDRDARTNLQTWVARLQKVKRDEVWAKDAAFYVRAHTALQKWRAATNASKKVKRREAFAHMRQKVKLAATQRIWQTWRDKTDQVKYTEQQAEHFSQQHLQNVRSSCLVLWHARTVELEQAMLEADAHDAGRLLQSHARLLSRRRGELQELHRQAATFYAESTSESAASILRDLNWRLFRIKRLQETADSLAERNRKKHYRNMLRYWAQRTRWQRQTLLEGEEEGENDDLIQFTSPSRESPHHHQQQQFRSSVSFVEPPSPARSTASRLPQRAGTFHPRRTTTAVTPGYLKTPSRRTARSASRVLSVSNTPATTQITPFMSRIYRSAQQQPSQYTNDEQRAASARSDIARRLFASGRRANFNIGPAIPEDAILAENQISPLRRISPLGRANQIAGVQSSHGINENEEDGDIGEEN